MLNKSDFLRPSQIKEMTGVSTPTIRKWREEGKLPGIKIGRVTLYKREDVEKLLQKGLEVCQ